MLLFLQDMGCLNLLKISKPVCNLFQRCAPPFIRKAATILDDPEDIVVEPNVDAIVILGQFIGEKQYSADIYQCSCHPKSTQV